MWPVFQSRKLISEGYIFFGVNQRRESVDIILIKVFRYFYDPERFPHFVWLQHYHSLVSADNFQFRWHSQLQGGGSIIISFVSQSCLNQVITSKANFLVK